MADNKKVCSIHNSILFGAGGSKDEIIRLRLIDAGFNLNEPIIRSEDFGNNSVIYTQFGCSNHVDAKTDPRSLLRKCIMDGKVECYFHMWSVRSQIVPPSPMIGGHCGGVIQETFAIVEDENGNINECFPHEIRFLDKPEDIIKKRSLFMTDKLIAEVNISNLDIAEAEYPEKLIESKLITAGFDLNKPFYRGPDSINNCVIFRQDILKNGEVKDGQ